MNNMKLPWTAKVVLGGYFFGIAYSIVFGLIVGVGWSTIMYSWYTGLPLGLAIGVSVGHGLQALGRWKKRVKETKHE